MVDSGTYPRMTATPMPPATSHTATRIPSGSVTVHGLRSVPSECEAFMPGSVGTESPAAYVVATVQDAPIRSIRKCTSDAQREALAALRTVPEPLTIARAVRHLGWPIHDVRNWLKELLARGYLVAEQGSRGCHRWSREARTA